MTEPSEVDAILASLDEHYWDPGEDPWGGANLETGEAYDPVTGAQSMPRGDERNRH